MEEFIVWYNNGMRGALLMDLGEIPQRSGSHETAARG
jgi:hypothetical protein